MVQNLLKLTAAVASWVVIASFWELCKVLTILEKLPTNNFAAFSPVLGSAIIFIEVASCMGSSFTNAVADANFVSFSG